MSGLLAWWDSGSGLILHTELKLKSEVLRLTGRCDYVRLCMDLDCAKCGGEGGVLGDVKTGGGRPYPETHIQLSGYELLYEVGLHQPPLCHTEVVSIPSKGGFSVYRGEGSRRGFFAAYALLNETLRLRG